eukprot:364794-Chlamydomonas_euryale.AAC.26
MPGPRVSSAAFSSLGLISTGCDAREMFLTLSGIASGTLSGVCARLALLDCHTGLYRFQLLASRQKEGGGVGGGQAAHWGGQAAHGGGQAAHGGGQAAHGGGQAAHGGGQVAGRSGGAWGRSGGAWGRSGGAWGRSGGAWGRSGGALGRPVALNVGKNMHVCLKRCVTQER